MRLAILSDIHGNYRALQAVLEDIALQAIDKIITLGDNIGYGPEPESVILRLKADNIDSLMGNHELALVSTSYFSRLNFIAQESLAITRSLLSPPSLQWLANLQPVILRNQARFCHGCPPASITKYLYAPSKIRLTRIFSDYHEQVCFSGHTHMLQRFILHQNQEITTQNLQVGVFRLLDDKRYLIIVGSVGQPRDSINNKAKYAIWDTVNTSCEIRQVEYDVETTIELLKKQNFPIHNAQRLKWSNQKK